VTGQFRVLCDGQHDEEAVEEQEEVVEAIGSEPVHVNPPKVQPPL
jgi:prephenate dehydrogenase